MDMDSTSLKRMHTCMEWIGSMRESGVLSGRSGSSSVESPNQRRDPFLLNDPDWAHESVGDC